MGLTLASGNFTPSQYLGAGLNAELAWEEHATLVGAAADNAMPWHVHLAYDSLTTAAQDEVASIASEGAATDGAWLAYDEPFTSQMAGIADVMNYIKSQYPEQLVYANLNLFTPSDIEYAISTMAPDVLMYTNYPFKADGSTDANYYERMMLYRNKAMAAGMPYWSFNQSAEWGGYRLPSESDLRMQLFSLLTAGYTGFAFYTYDQIAGITVNSILGPENVPTSVYTALQTALPEAGTIGEYTKMLESTGVYFVPAPGNATPAGLTNFAGDGRISSITVNDTGTGKNGLLGLFTDNQCVEYFMLTNLNHGDGVSATDASLSFTIQFDPSVDRVFRISRTTGLVDQMALTSGAMTVTLPGGTGDLFLFPSGRLDGDCVTNIKDFAILARDWSTNTSPGVYLPAIHNDAVEASASATASDWDVHTPVDTSGWINAGYSDGHYYKGLLKFPEIVDIAGKTVSRATLHVKLHYTGGAAGNGTSLGLNVRASSVQSPWSASTTYDTLPAIQTSGPYTSVTASDQWYELDITDAVQDWADGTVTNYDLLVDAQYINPDYQVIKMFYDAGTNDAPYVTIETGAVASASATASDWDINAPVYTSSWIQAGYSDGHYYKGLLKFPEIADIAGKDIIRGILNLKLYYTGGAVGNGTSLGLNVSASSVQSSWSASTTYATLPAIQTSGPYTSVTAPGQWYMLDVTDAVQDWADGTVANYDLLVDAQYIDPSYQVVKMFYDAGTADAPTLSIIEGKASSATALARTWTSNPVDTGVDIQAGCATNVDNQSEGLILKSLLKFDASDLAGHTISSATLHMHLVYTAGDYVGGSNPNQALNVYVSSIQDEWTTATASDALPAIQSSGPYTYVTSPGWYEFDVTEAVRDWADGTVENNDLRVDAQFIPQYGVFKSFSNADSNKPPYLTVTTSVVCGDSLHPYPDGDLNYDCAVDIEDLQLLISNWLE